MGKNTYLYFRSLGFTPVDLGNLRSAREIEDIPVQRFPQWKTPLIISLAIFLFYFGLAFGKYVKGKHMYIFKKRYDFTDFFQVSDLLDRNLGCLEGVALGAIRNDSGDNCQFYVSRSRLDNVGIV